MEFSRKDIELLAPVGSREMLMAAIQSKANAVYLGIGNLNMRSNSTSNFSINDLEGITNLCHTNNLKVYVTLNTVMYDEDIDAIHNLINYCKLHNVDAIIASDISVIQYASSIKMPLHISTQVNISNFEALSFFSKYADVAVLARELSLSQIKEICNKVQQEQVKGPSGEIMRIEIFAHGALCMAVSGKCYLSLHKYNKSANRGECFQVCRRGYTVTDKDDEVQLDIDNDYIMSPKDLCTISFLDKILNSGVRVLKIEGRARAPEYVKTVVECYNEAINLIINKSFTQEKIDGLTNKLKEVYNRGFWEGYYLGSKTGEWSNVHGSLATKKKVYIGKALNYFSNIKVAEFLIETGDLRLGDEILIIGPTTGVLEIKLSEIRVNLVPVNIANKGDRFSIHVETAIRRSDKIYKLISSE
jgi:putative protease